MNNHVFAEYIDYHLSPETITPPPNLPRILNGGGGGWDNVTAQLGAKAALHCLVQNRQEKTVSEWGGREGFIIGKNIPRTINHIRVAQNAAQKDVDGAS